MKANVGQLFSAPPELRYSLKNRQQMSEPNSTKNNESHSGISSAAAQCVWFDSRSEQTRFYLFISHQTGFSFSSLESSEERLPVTSSAPTWRCYVTSCLCSPDICITHLIKHVAACNTAAAALLHSPSRFDLINRNNLINNPFCWAPHSAPH